MLLTRNENALGGLSLNLFAIGDDSGDDLKPLASTSDLIVLESVEMSSDGHFIITIMNEKVKITENVGKAMEVLFKDAPPEALIEKNLVLVQDLHLSVWPSLELQQMYRDAWRMLRDYFYDPDMHSVDWDEGRLGVILLCYFIFVSCYPSSHV